MKFTKVFVKIAEGFKNNRFIIQQGGSSSSKSYSAIQFIIVLALKSNDKKLFSIVSETIPHLKRGVMRDFFKIIMESGLYREENHNKTDSTYELGNWTIEFFEQRV